VLAPALPKFLLENPKITVEVSVDSRLVDLVREGFDAGIRWGNNVDQDMVAVRVGPNTSLIVVGSPDYLERNPRPQIPTDLDQHNCIVYRLITGGGLFPWKLERDGKEMRTRIGGQLILDDPDLAASLMMAGAGLGLILEQKASPHLLAGRLVRVLDEWCIPFQGLHLYYPSRQVTPALRALTDALKWKAPDPEQA
jgi:DNA-binding transcriptional LysR family regulator